MFEKNICRPNLKGFFYQSVNNVLLAVIKWFASIFKEYTFYQIHIYL